MIYDLGKPTNPLSLLPVQRGPRSRLWLELLLLPGTDNLLPKSTSQKASHTQFNLPTSTRGDPLSPWSTDLL